MQDFVKRWEELKKALSHASAIDPAVSKPKTQVPTDVHPDHLPLVKYGVSEIPGGSAAPGQNSDNMGFAKIDGKGHVVRHGAKAQRTDIEHQMSKLLGADHMLPDQSYDHGLNHPDYHNSEDFMPSYHGGTSIQEHVDGKHIDDALEDKDHTQALKNQWKSGDLHKLWALHYISNNGDMHPSNFKVTKDGVKAFDSDMAFHELPHAHTVSGDEGTGEELNYMPHSFSQLPSYLSPFVKNERHEQDDGIEAKHADQQVSVKALNEHAAKINPDLFAEFGPHAAERAAKAKKALMSSDPTGEMKKLWHDHEDKTGDLTWDKMQSPSKKKLAA